MIQDPTCVREDGDVLGGRWHVVNGNGGVGGNGGVDAYEEVDAWNGAKGVSAAAGYNHF